MKTLPILVTGVLTGIAALPLQSANHSAVRNPQSAIVLFDGKSLDAWKSYKTDAVPQGWKIVDGALVKDTRVADIVSKDQFGDFELELEWRIGGGGNSGIFYRGTDEYD